MCFVSGPCTLTGSKTKPTTHLAQVDGNRGITHLHWVLRLGLSLLCRRRRRDDCHHSGHGTGLVLVGLIILFLGDLHFWWFLSQGPYPDPQVKHLLVADGEAPLNAGVQFK